MLGRRPKDFDIGTSAHPYEIKKLFRNCWIIGESARIGTVSTSETQNLRLKSCAIIA